MHRLKSFTRIFDEFVALEIIGGSAELQLNKMHRSWAERDLMSIIRMNRSNET